MTDVDNACLNAITKEKCDAFAGKELGSDEGKIVKIVRAMYDRKSSGAAWHAHSVSINLTWVHLFVSQSWCMDEGI